MTEPAAQPTADGTRPEALWVLQPGAVGTAWEAGEHERVATVRVAEGRGLVPLRHPGVLDASSGHVSHRLQIEFSLDQATSAELRLRGSADRGPCPDLEVTLDGVHRGVFHPGVLRTDRQHSAEPGPISGMVSLDVTFPAEWLGPGSHVLTVATVLDAAAALGEDREHDHRSYRRPVEALGPARAAYGDWFGSYLSWSRLDLVPLPDAAEPGPSSAVSLRATPFYRAISGDEVELVDCDISWRAGTAPPPVHLQWDDRVLTAPSPPADRDFGTFRWRFPAPALDAPTTVWVVTPDGGQPHELSPARRWTLHLVPHVHLDLGFTDHQGKVLELHCRNIDQALELIEHDPGFRFAVDGSMVVAQYLATRTPERGERLRRAIASGHIGVNAFHSNFLSGVLSLPELYRSTDLARSLPVPATSGLSYANLTDVPFGNRTIPSVLADLGVDGFVTMTNHGRAATATSDQVHLLSPVRWRGPDGAEVLAHVADHYSQLRFVAADPQSVVGAADGLDRLLARHERPDYLPSDLPLIGTHADNEDLADGDTGFVQRWNEVFAWPRLRVSSFAEYLAAVRPLQDRLPVWEHETGSFWEDGMGSVAADAATYRRTQAVLPASETLGTLVARASPGLRVHREELDRAWEGLAVAAEHTFTWSRSTSHPHADAVADQLGWKRRHLVTAHRIARDEMRRHLAQLAELCDLTGPGVLAWNPHAWAADLETEIELDAGTELVGPAGPVATEVLADCAGRQRRRVGLGRMAGHSWRFLPLSAAPTTHPGGGAGLGRSGDAAGVPSGDLLAVDPGAVVETETWSLLLDAASGLPAELRHRPSGRQLLDTRTARRLGQLVRTGPRPATEAQRERPTGDVHRHERVPLPSVADWSPGATPGPMTTESPDLDLVGTRHTHDGVRLRWEGAGAGTQDVRLELLLRDDDSCELTVSFDKLGCLDAEALYVAFPFGAEEPILRYDRPLGWVRPDRDHGPGAANEWGTVTSTVSLESADGEIWWTPLDTPLFTAGDVVRGTWATDFPAAPSHLYAYAMNNFWPCNTPAEQPGPVSFSFRFGVSPGFDPVASTRRGRTARLPAQAVELLPLDRFRPGRPVEPRSGSLAILDEDPGLDLILRPVAQDQVELSLVNLGPDAVVLGGPGADGPLSGCTIPGFGVRRVILPRTGPEDGKVRS